MAQVTRLVDVFQITTVAGDPAVAIARSGGWSEGHWTTLNQAAYTPIWNSLRTKRANLLPKQVSMVGFRTQLYDLTGNKLTPLGTGSGKQFVKGMPIYDCDIAQMALEITSSGTNSISTTKFTIRGIPDSVVITGEFDPSFGYNTDLTIWRQGLEASGFGWVGRDRDQVAQRVMSYGNNIVSLSGPLAGAVVGSFVRFLRVYDKNGEPVEGVFPIASISGNNYTLQNGPTQDVLKPSGLMRLDLLKFIPYLTTGVGAIVPKKVGVPSRRYRGRRSKRRV